MDKSFSAQEKDKNRDEVSTVSACRHAAAFGTASRTKEMKRVLYAARF